MEFEATATFDNGRKIIFELEEYQVHSFVDAVFNKTIYEDEKTGMISWLPPERLHHLIVKPNMESPTCPQKSQNWDQESDLLTSPNQ